MATRRNKIRGNITPKKENKFPPCETMRTDSNSRFPALNRPETPVAHNPAGTKVERPISIHQVNKTGGHGNFQPSRDLNERSWSRYQEWRRTSNLKISQRSRLRERRRSPWSPLITFHGIAKKESQARERRMESKKREQREREAGKEEWGREWARVEGKELSKKN